MHPNKNTSCTFNCCKSSATRQKDVARNCHKNIKDVRSWEVAEQLVQCIQVVTGPPRHHPIPLRCSGASSLSMVSSTGPWAAAKPRVKLQRHTAKHDAVRALTTQRLWPDERGAFPFALLFRRVHAVEWAFVPTCRVV